MLSGGPKSKAPKVFTQKMSVHHLESPTLDAYYFEGFVGSSFCISRLFLGTNRRHQIHFVLILLALVMLCRVVLLSMLFVKRISSLYSTLTRILYVWSFLLLFQYQKNASIDMISLLFLALLLHIFLGTIHIQGYESIFLSNFSFETYRLIHKPERKQGWMVLYVGEAFWPKMHNGLHIIHTWPTC